MKTTPPRTTTPRPNRVPAWMHTLWQNRKARIGLYVLAMFFCVAFIGPFLVADPNAFSGMPRQAPGADALLGTNGQGQDVLAQTIVATRTSLFLGLGVGVLVVLIGAIVGVTAGYFGGRTDDLLSLIVNIFLVIPGLPLAIVVAAYLPTGTFTIAMVLVFTGWAWNARVLRAQTLAIREKDFVAAAIVSGERHLFIIMREIVPNMSSLMTSQFIGGTIFAIGAQVGLEFLGMGDLSQVTWGTNLYWATNNQALLTGTWWTFIPTGLCIATVGFALAMVNFGIDEMTNPRLASERVWREHLESKGHRASASTPVMRS